MIDAGRGYVIPRAFVVDVAHESDGSFDVALIQVLWPGMEPLTEANRHLWAPELPGRQRIDVLLFGRPRDGFKGLQAMIRMGWLGSLPEPGPYGLLKYERDNPRAQITIRQFVPADTSYLAPKGSPVVINCNDTFDWKAKIEMNIRPTCAVEYPLIDGVGLKYHFYLTNLKYWQEIDISVRDLVHSFGKM